MIMIWRILSVLWSVVRGAIRAVAIGLAVLSIVVGGFALANYTATQGSGTNFGSVVIGGVHFMSQLICDFTTANQCATVNANNSMQVDANTSSQIHTDLTAAVPCLNATASNTNSYSTGQTNPANCNLNGNLYAVISGYDSGTKIGTGAGSSTSHTAGQSVGGLITVPAVRTNGGSGIISNFSLIDAGGTATALLVRVWQKNPASTTCTDGSGFVSNATDDQQLITPPFSVTPAAPANTTGDSKFYASNGSVKWDYLNGSSNTNLYVCLITVATQTIAGSNETVTLSGPQN